MAHQDDSDPRNAEIIASELNEIRQRERKDLQTRRAYRLGNPALTWLPASAPRELQVLAKTARINLCDLVVKNVVQQMTVDGYEHADADAGELIWAAWQANRWDRKQLGVHRAVSTYGVAFGTALTPDTTPTGGDADTGGNDAPDDAEQVPVMRAVSPLAMTATYDSGDDWPDYALEYRDNADKDWWLYTPTHIHVLRRGDRRTVNGKTVTFDHVDSMEHDAGVTPVVRYLADEDLDDPVRGDIEPIMSNQDMLNLTAFHLLVAQNYGAHGRQFLIGMMVDELEKQLRSSAASTHTIKARPEDFRVEKVDQTQLDGFIASRESGARFLAAISQIPAYELLGNVSQLAAATLAEARNSTDRKLAERRTVVGESHEQLLGLVGHMMGIDVDPAARVRWQPNRDQRMFQVVDMIATISERLNVPAETILSQLPFSDATIGEWRHAIAERAESDAGQAGHDISELQPRAEALGAMIRASVTPESAAQAVGLEGLEFTGLVPVTLRDPHGEDEDNPAGQATGGE